MADVTQILQAIEQREPHAAEQLLPLVYDELRKLAAKSQNNWPQGLELDDQPVPRKLAAQRASGTPP
jgi:hypothetical protein